METKIVDKNGICSFIEELFSMQLNGNFVFRGYSKVNELSSCIQFYKRRNT